MLLIKNISSYCVEADVVWWKSLDFHGDEIESRVVRQIYEFFVLFKGLFTLQPRQMKP